MAAHRRLARREVTLDVLQIRALEIADGREGEPPQADVFLGGLGQRFAVDVTTQAEIGVAQVV